MTTKKNDQSGKKWDVKDETGLRYAKGVVNVEYHRDIKPIFERSCVACHSGKSDKPAGNLVLDDDKLVEGRWTGQRRPLPRPTSRCRQGHRSHRATSGRSSRATAC